MRTAILWAGVLAGLLATGCRVATSRSAERKEAVRANTISNKHILTETDSGCHLVSTITVES